MLFHEIYSTYFQTVAKILAEAVEHPLTTEEINAIIQDYAFEESILNIPKSLGMAHWQLLKEDGTTILRKNPTMPLTILQKRWINAIALDPRIRLFTDQPVVFSDVEPLFLPEDIYVFDKYSDGDPYENPEYIQNFRLILDAIKHQYPIQISITNRHGKRITTRTIPEYLEYSEKDDKFRLIGTGSKLGNTINLGRITSCEKCENQQGGKVGKRNLPQPRKVLFELVDDRNALERVLMHFAHFEKQVEKVDERKYQVTLYYDKEDETEILIRVLSFGPMLRVVKPVAFINLIRAEIQEALKRLKKNYEIQELDAPNDICWLYGSFMDDYLHDVEICQRFARRSRERMAEIIIERTKMTRTEAFHTIHNYIHGYFWRRCNKSYNRIFNRSFFNKKYSAFKIGYKKRFY